jgi:hypothetical protein
MKFAKLRSVDMLNECRCTVASWYRLDNYVGGYPKLARKLDSVSRPSKQFDETGKPVRIPLSY